MKGRKRTRSAVVVVIRADRRGVPWSGGKKIRRREIVKGEEIRYKRIRDFGM